MTSSPMTAADVLREARRLIQEKRFARGARTMQPGCTCSLLAISTACVGDDADFDRVAGIFEAANDTGCIPIWHDSQPNKRAVLRGFDRAIALASGGDLP